MRIKNMKRSSFNNLKAYHYLLFTIILLLGILTFYLSCKSKSPTEPASQLYNQISTQSTNNTTTSSSTTTITQPGNSPTNTTTLITSRYLTTTSTTTSSTPTTSTSTTTTSVPSPYLEWCAFYVERCVSGWCVKHSVNNGDTINSGSWTGFHIFPKIKNKGTAPAENVTVTVKSIKKNTTKNIYTVHDDTAFLGTIPADGKCIPIRNDDKIMIEIGHPELFDTGDKVALTFIESYSNKTFSFIIGSH
jgi:hypothetical protein